MKITIVGAGRVGVHLAKYFSNEHQDVYLVDKDAEKLSILDADFNMRTFVGEPTDFNVLREANAETADVFAAVTADTEDNLVACAMAKSMGARLTIARVERYDFMDPANAAVVSRMGVDRIVYPELLAAQTVINALEHPWCRSWDDFDNEAILLTAVSINSHAPIVGHKLKELSADNSNFHISALRRDNKTIIPRGDDYVIENDILYFTSVPAAIDRVMELCGKSDFNIKNVLIMGGSKIAEIIDKIAPRKYSLTLIEKDRMKCRTLAENCNSCSIIYGDASERDVLEEAGISKCDAFVALSNITEGNLLACITAKEARVRRTIAEIEKEQFIDKGESFGIGTIINKPIITANAIFQLILDSDTDTKRCFAMTHAEVARLEIREDSFLTSAPIKDLKLPRELTFAGLIRNNEGFIVNGDTRFRAGDQVIVFCMNGALNIVEKLFSK